MRGSRVKQAPAATKPIPTLAPGDVVEIECTDMIAKSGQAVGRANGMVVYVFGPIPPERARVRIQAVKARYAVGELLELLSHSTDRAEPFCDVFGTCGGCQLQHMTYSAQLRWKRNVVHNALRRIGGIVEGRVGATIGMDFPQAYRNKMALVVDSTDEKASFGFYAARSHDVVPIETCPIVEPALDGCLGGLWEAADDPGSAPAFQGARHVVARAGRPSGEAVVSITTERAWRGEASSVTALARHLPGVVGITNTFELSSDNAIVGRRKFALYGGHQVEEVIEGLRFRISPASFFQVNGEIVARIYRFIGAGAERLQSVGDLYCGSGTFSLFFARAGARVVGVDENAAAIREARANASANELDSKTTFVAERVESAVRKKTFADLTGEADLLFLDPPRKGVDAAALTGIAALRAPYVWYLSCDPATLARDLAQLLAAGYRLEGVQPFDMFPQTGHVEALAALRLADAEPFGLDFAEAE